MKKTWEFINKSVRGASHLRKNAPCQDYSLCSIGEKGRLPMLLAVSDGHGGSRYVRSAQGAVYACEAAIWAAGGYAADIFSGEDANLIKQIAETRLKLDILKRWQSAVLEHIEENPLSDEELCALGISRGEFNEAIASPNLTDKEILLTAYGATLLLAIVLDNVIILEQLGDGDIIFYYKNRREKFILPILKDETLLGNETTSLCSLKAPFYLRHNIIYLYDRANIPDLIMLATDGYSNSFSSAEGYLKTAEDYHNMLTSEGAVFVNENIEGWLAETSAGGSGDDITIVVAWRGGAGE